MKLAAEVDVGGQTEALEIDMGSLTDSELVKCVALVGNEKMEAMAFGDWSEDAANAMVYVKLFMPGDSMPDEVPAWSDFSVDWGLVGLAEPDSDMEAALADLSGAD